MRDCFFCSNPLPEATPEGPRRGDRLAFDPWRGRLWSVCPTCLRWNPVPLEERWETLEGLERSVEGRGRIRVASDQLALVRVGPGELVRVGRPPRVALAGWRYGDRIPLPGMAGRPFRGLLTRILARLPAPPVGGYNPYAGRDSAVPPASWMASPFLEHAVGLTFAFTHVPFAPRCPSCSLPMALEPWDFSQVGFADSRDGSVEAPCGHCRELVLLDIRDARPAIRLGLGIVTPPAALRTAAEAGAQVLEEGGGPLSLLRTLRREGTPLGSLELPARVGLLIALDELAELEALEREWREAEEIAAIMDGELTDVTGFDAFRRRVLGPGGPEADGSLQA